jgi:hypothetical protein
MDPFVEIPGWNMLKSIDMISRQLIFQINRTMVYVVLLTEVFPEAEKVPAIAATAIFAGSEATAVPVDSSPGVIVAKMFPDLLAALEAFAGSGSYETTMIKRTEGVVFMLCLSNMLQPFVFSSKGSALGRARVIWAFPPSLN